MFKMGNVKKNVFKKKMINLILESVDIEPQRKRICFLSSLEDRAMIDDELECYLRSQFPAVQTKCFF